MADTSRAAGITGPNQRRAPPGAASVQGPSTRGLGGPWLTYGADRRAEGQQEAQAAVEQRQRHAQHALQRFLSPPHPGAGWVRELLEELVLPKREDRHQRGPGRAEAHLTPGPGARRSPPPQGSPGCAPRAARASSPVFQRQLDKPLLIPDPEAQRSGLCLQRLQGPSHGQDRHLAASRPGQQICRAGLGGGHQTWGKAKAGEVGVGGG